MLSLLLIFSWRVVELLVFFFSLILYDGKQNFLLWWKNWLRGVCFFPLHSLITRHSNTYGSGINMRRMPRILRPLNNDVSFLFRLERESNMRLEGGRVRKERKPSIIIIESSCICIFRNFNDAKQTFSFYASCTRYGKTSVQKCKFTWWFGF